MPESLSVETVFIIRGTKIGEQTCVVAVDGLNDLCCNAIKMIQILPMGNDPTRSIVITLDLFT